MKAKQSFAFYTRLELKTLREIKSLPTRKERTAALDVFCKKYNRTHVAALGRMRKLNRVRKAVAKASAGNSDSTTVNIGSKFVLHYKNMEIKGGANGGEIIFTW